MGETFFGTFVTIAKLPDKIPVHGLLEMIYATIEKITGLLRMNINYTTTQDWERMNTIRKFVLEPDSIRIVRACPLIP